MPDGPLTVETLLARAEILDCLNRYARGMDRLDRELARSAYHDDATDDHAGYVAPVEEFLDWAFGYHAEQVRHQHYLSNHTIEIHGDVAHSETYYTFVGTWRDPDKPLEVVGGRYIDRLERRDGRWAIAVRVCTGEWRLREPSALSEKAAAVMAAEVHRDPSDASYRRPLHIQRDS